MAANNKISYSRQDFLDTARRRVREARALLDHPNPQKRRDGAVTMALLAAECALKAVLMHGFQLNTTTDANEKQRNLWFGGSSGHNLAILWNEQHSSLRSQVTDFQNEAVSELHKADCYEYRYGRKKPKREHAEPFVQHAETLIQWTETVLGVAL